MAASAGMAGLCRAGRMRAKEAPPPVSRGRAEQSLEDEG